MRDSDLYTRCAHRYGQWFESTGELAMSRSACTTPGPRTASSHPAWKTSQIYNMKSRGSRTNQGLADAAFVFWPENEGLRLSTPHRTHITRRERDGTIGSHEIVVQEQLTSRSNTSCSCKTRIYAISFLVSHGQARRGGTSCMHGLRSR